MIELRIQQQFIDSADLKYQSAEALSKPIAAALQALLACVTSGGKVLACGNGGSAAQARHLVAQFVGRFERARPELPAIALDDGAVLSALAGEQDFAPVFARQVRALGQAGDLLLVMSPGPDAANLLAAVEAAHEREMTVVALTGRGSNRIGAALREMDVQVNVPHERAARVEEVHLLILHCLCDGVDTQLLGEQEVTT
ncbi:MAG: DnaA initiator-associating protein DiaA [Burkholderiaceae bacterium]|jgi:D-sedoheptulose 7-phosphate isomerase|nr:MAG: DnaA initiator-associating protein DiaA [Burkholderiaceae bacterium]